MVMTLKFKSVADPAFVIAPLVTISLLNAQIKHLRPKQYKNLKKREKTVSRAYGGSRCAGCVRQR